MISQRVVIHSGEEIALDITLRHTELVRHLSRRIDVLGWIIRDHTPEQRNINGVVLTEGVSNQIHTILLLHGRSQRHINKIGDLLPTDEEQGASHVDITISVLLAELVDVVRIIHFGDFDLRSLHDVPHESLRLVVIHAI